MNAKFGSDSEALMQSSIRVLLGATLAAIIAGCPRTTDEPTPDKTIDEPTPDKTAKVLTLSAGALLSWQDVIERGRKVWPDLSASLGGRPVVFIHTEVVLTRNATESIAALDWGMRDHQTVLILSGLSKRVAPNAFAAVRPLDEQVFSGIPYQCRLYPSAGGYVLALAASGKHLQSLPTAVGRVDAVDRSAGD